MQHRRRKKKAGEGDSESPVRADKKDKASAGSVTSYSDQSQPAKSQPDSAKSAPKDTGRSPSENSEDGGSDNGSSDAGSSDTRSPGKSDAAKADSETAGAAGPPPAGTSPETFSINQALKKGRQGRQDQQNNNGKQEEEEQEVSVDTGKDRRENFTTEQIYEAFKELAEQYREKPRLYNMLRSREPEKQDDEVILVRLENPLQDQQIKKIYGTVLIHLKNYLQNDYITLNTEIVEEQSKGNNKLYTDEDKYQYMEKKNQNLRQLRQNFDLDFD